MKILVRLVLILILGVAVWWGYRAYFPDDETVICQRLQTLAGKASFASRDGQLARLTYAESVVDFFSPEVSINLVEVRAELSALQGRDQLRQLLLAARNLVSQVRLRFVDIQPKVDAQHDAATVLATAIAEVNNESATMVHELKFRLIKTNGVWLIHQVNSVKVLRLPK